ncbi:dynamin family protein [Moorellaceae bacterium AZ2]
MSQLVTETGNPHNHKGISAVEVYYPSPLLREGVVLIDTPGIGSTFRHNTEVTLNFLPQCDAALFLVSADPPVTEVEVEFLKAVRVKVSHLFFVLNKIDYLSEEEIASLKLFLKKVLREQVGMEENPIIFCVSARQGLEAKKLNDPSLWALSGMQEVWNHLVDFLAHDTALYERLQATISATRGAIQAARTRRLEQAQNLSQEITQLQFKINELQEIRAQLLALFASGGDF